MNTEEILEKIGAEKMVELKIKEKEIKELNKNIKELNKKIKELNKKIDELEKEVKRKNKQINDETILNRKLSLALEEIYAKMGVKASVNQLILHF